MIIKESKDTIKLVLKTAKKREAALEGIVNFIRENGGGGEYELTEVAHGGAVRFLFVMNGEIATLGYTTDSI